MVPFALGPSDLSDVDALAFVEIIAGGFNEPTGIVVDQTGAVFVSDRKAGEVLKIAGGRISRVITHLSRPVGLSFDREGRLLIVEEKSGSLFRLEPDGRLTILAHGMNKPRWLTVAEDGTVYLSAKGLRGDRDNDGDRDDDDENEEDEGEVILRLTRDGFLAVFADGFKGVEGIAVRGKTLFAAAKGLKHDHEREQAHEHGELFQIPILADGSAGPITRRSQTEIERPVGLVLDTLGALYVSAEEIELPRRDAKEAIGKVAVDGSVGRFASNLEKPRGLALDNFGNLYVADDGGDKRGRILRFRAPPSPTLIFPSFTNQSSLTVEGAVEPQSRIDAFLNGATLPQTFREGAFELILDLKPESPNSLAVFATSHNGQGLSSAPAEVMIVHDDIRPAITGLQSLNGSYLNTRTPLMLAGFSDSGSGIDVPKVKVSLDGMDVTSQAQITESGFTLNVEPLGEGSHMVFVTVWDKAGNSASASTTFTVDVTPPDTQITGGPEGNISATSAVFTFNGSDNLTPAGSLEFSWRLDGGTFSASSSQAQASFTHLAPGPHTFEVKARDLAGNEDLSPASRSFTISTLQVLITEPADGATVVSGNLLVRGSVEAGRAEVGVTVNGFSAADQGNTFAALIHVTPETSSLTAIATTATGTTATHITSISVSPTTTSPVALHASPQSGAAPLTVQFSLLGRSVPTTIDLDFNGDGTVDFTGSSLEGQTFNYTQPGVYVSTVRMTDTQGNQQAAEAVVQVFDRTALDIMLQAKWNGMKDALQRGDIEGALQFIVADSRAEFRTDFSALGPFLPNLASTLNNIQLVAVRREHIEYQLLNVENGVTFSYYVEFISDADGIWRIAFF